MFLDFILWNYSAVFLIVIIITSGIATDREMIQHQGIVIYMIVGAVLIIVLNIYAGYEIFRRQPETR